MSTRRICFISKYPPIEGGVSSRTYWLLRGLGQRGQKIHLVTNAWEVENEYRESLSGEDLDSYQPDNVVVHNTNPYVDPTYIPYSPSYSEKMSSLAIEVVREHELELIDTWYLVPYGVSGYLAKSFVSRPLIIRHAGSDMARLLTSPYLHTILSEVVNSADRILTHSGIKQTFRDLGVKDELIHLDTGHNIDSEVFNARVEPFDLEKELNRNLDDMPVITYIGKVTASKGVFELTEALRRIKTDFLMLFVAGGREIRTLINDVSKKGLDNRSEFLGFRPPWQIPGILRASTCVVIPERDFPIRAHAPILPREAMATGRCTILSEEIFSKRRYRELEPDVHTIVVNPKDIEDFSAKLEKVIRNPDYAETIGREAGKVAESHEDFDSYISSTISFYHEVVDTG